MADYLLYFLIPLILLLIFFLIKLFIVKYFEARKKRYAKESNYPIIYGSLILLTAFFAVAVPQSPFLYLLAKLIKEISGIEVEVTNTINIYSVIMFALLCAAVVLIFFIYYRRYRLEIELSERDEMKKTQQIAFPKDPEPESPIFHERIKELFTLKNKKNNLYLDYDGKDKILFGKFKEGLHKFAFVIYCDDSVAYKTVSKDEQNRIYDNIKQKIVPELIKDDEETLVDIYYLLEKGKFEENDNEKLITLSEDDFLNELIDFNRYLQELVHKFKNDKLFSAIANEEDKFTLEETFIKPSFNDKKEDLDKYLDDWLLESNLKHLVILGDYGMGKSSFLKYYSAKLAEEILCGKKLKRFPVFISLTNTSPMHGGIEKSVGHFVSQKLGVDSDIFQKLVHRGKILFILDGFDEMGFIGTHEQRFEQFNSIWQLATKNNKVLIAGRPSYFPTEFELKSTLNITEKENEVIQVKPYCESLTLDRFDEKRIEESIKKYYPEKYQFDKYISFIKGNKSIYDLCSRPSMMHIIREMLPNIHEKFKNETLTPGKLMKQYVEYWIDRQESKCIRSAFKANDKKKKDFIIDFFKELAEDFFIKDDLKLSAKDIGKKLRTKLRDLQFEEDNTEIIEGFESELLTGYFVEIEGNEYKFVHKSFFEYFVTIKIVDLINSKDLKNPIMAKDWTFEIIDFLYDFIDSKKCSRKNIPSLLCLLNSNIIANIKSSLFDIFTSISVRLGIWTLIFIAGASAIFFMILLYFTSTITAESGEKDIIEVMIFSIVLMIPIILVGYIRKVSFESHKFFKFIYKSYKIAFLRKEIDIRKSMRLILFFVRYAKYAKSPFFKDIKDIQIKNRHFLEISYFNSLLISNVSFINCLLNGSLFMECSLENVNFDNTFLISSRFDNCKFQNVKFDNCRLRYSFFFKRKGSYRIPSENTKTKSVKSNVFEKLGFINIEKYNMDESTLMSLKKLLKKGNYVVGKHIAGDEWLMEELKKGDSSSTTSNSSS